MQLATASSSAILKTHSTKCIDLIHVFWCQFFFLICDISTYKIKNYFANHSSSDVLVKASHTCYKTPVAITKLHDYKKWYNSQVVNQEWLQWFCMMLHSMTEHCTSRQSNRNKGPNKLLFISKVRQSSLSPEKLFYKILFRFLYYSIKNYFL